MKRKTTAARKSAHKRTSLKRNAKGQFVSTKRGKSKSGRARYARKSTAYLSW